MSTFPRYKSMFDLISEHKPTGYEVQLWLQRRGVFVHESKAIEVATLHTPNCNDEDNLKRAMFDARCTFDGLSRLLIGDATIEKCGALYVPNYTMPQTNERGSSLSDIETELLGLEWITKRTARHEYFMSSVDRTYSYGNRGLGSEEYTSKPFSALVERIMMKLNHDLMTDFNVCFLNKYDDQHQHLGWHADEFPGMREEQPIAVVSFGAEREIWLKDKRGFPCECQFSAQVSEFGLPPCSKCEGSGWKKNPPNDKQPFNQRISLQRGSLFIMPPGYQKTHLHRIPKHDRMCSWRVSLTFRSFV